MTILQESIIASISFLALCYAVTHYLMADDIKQVLFKKSRKQYEENFNDPSGLVTFSSELALSIILVYSSGLSFLFGLLYYHSFK